MHLRSLTNIAFICLVRLIIEPNRRLECVVKNYYALVLCIRRQVQTNGVETQNLLS